MIDATSALKRSNKYTANTFKNMSASIKNMQPGNATAKLFADTDIKEQITKQQKIKAHNTKLFKNYKSNNKITGKDCKLYIDPKNLYILKMRLYDLRLRQIISEHNNNFVSDSTKVIKDINILNTNIKINELKEAKFYKQKNNSENNEKNDILYDEIDEKFKSIEICYTQQHFAKTFNSNSKEDEKIKEKQNQLTKLISQIKNLNDKKNQTEFAELKANLEELKANLEEEINELKKINEQNNTKNDDQARLNLVKIKITDFHLYVINGDDDITIKCGKVFKISKPDTNSEETLTTKENKQLEIKILSSLCVVTGYDDNATNLKTPSYTF